MITKFKIFETIVFDDDVQKSMTEVLRKKIEANDLDYITNYIKLDGDVNYESFYGTLLHMALTDLKREMIDLLAPLTDWTKIETFNKRDVLNHATYFYKNYLIENYPDQYDKYLLNKNLNNFGI